MLDKKKDVVVLVGADLSAAQTILWTAAQRLPIGTAICNI